jgi:hypothetical protein
MPGSRKRLRYPRRGVLAAGVAAMLAAGGALAAGGPVAASAQPPAPRGALFVTNALANSVTEYMANARGNTRPIATITGSSTGLTGPAGIAVTEGPRP